MIIKRINDLDFLKNFSILYPHEKYTYDDKKMPVNPEKMNFDLLYTLENKYKKI